MPDQGRYLKQLESIHEISVEIAALRDLTEIYDRALDCCLSLTSSAMGFVDLLTPDGVVMDVVAVKGFEPSDPGFYDRFRTMPVRPGIFGVVILEERSNISNDVEHDPRRLGTPPGHPPVHTFLGVPLKVGPSVIGMIGVANKAPGYGSEDERLLSTFANQVAVAIHNARLYERQRNMITGLQQLQQRLGSAEREQLLALERDRIAAGLHDDIEQQIFTIGLRLNSLLESGRLDAESEACVREIRQLSSRTAQQVRDVIFALAVDAHGSPDLVASVRRLLDEVPAPAGIETELVVTGEATERVSGVQGPIYAMVKEMLHNVVKHANASTVVVSLRIEADHVDVIVQDDGGGAPEEVLLGDNGRRGHLGLRNMRRQAAALRGTLEVTNGDDAGVTVKARIPLPVG